MHLLVCILGCATTRSVVKQSSSCMPNCFLPCHRVAIPSLAVSSSERKLCSFSYRPHQVYFTLYWMSSFAQRFWRPYGADTATSGKLMSRNHKLTERFVASLQCVRLTHCCLSSKDNDFQLMTAMSIFNRLPLSFKDVIKHDFVHVHSLARQLFHAQLAKSFGKTRQTGNLPD